MPNIYEVIDYLMNGIILEAILEMNEDRPKEDKKTLVLQSLL